MTEEKQDVFKRVTVEDPEMQILKSTIINGRPKDKGTELRIILAILDLQRGTEL